jgi:hypothetical protein
MFYQQNPVQFQISTPFPDITYLKLVLCTTHASALRCVLHTATTAQKRVRLAMGKEWQSASAERAVFWLPLLMRLLSLICR